MGLQLRAHCRGIQEQQQSAREAVALVSAQSQSSKQPEVLAEVSPSPEDVWRANLYRLLSHLLSGAPTAGDLAVVANLNADEASPLGRAAVALAEVARQTTAEAEAEAFQTLFIGLGRGLFLPYGSYYLTGFLHEKPLARLRQDMAALGIEAASDVSEPEDHVASVLEMMAGLIDGTFGAQSTDAEPAFYKAHVGSWAAHFFRDLAGSEPSRFYAALGTLGCEFMEIEERALRLA